MTADHVILFNKKEQKVIKTMLINLALSVLQLHHHSLYKTIYI